MNEDRNKYMRDYNREKRVRVSLNLSKEKDKDIISALDKIEKRNKQPEILKLIRKGLNS